MAEEIDKLAGAIGETLKTVPAIYEDALQPAAQEFGKFAARIPRAINAAFSSLDKWILNKEYAIDETKKLLEQKLRNVDPEKIVSPEAYVAVPALQAISYSMDNEELRNLYANLLAKAMVTNTRNSVHPSFVEIIKQMSPLDAIIYKRVMETDIRPLITISEQAKDGGNRPIYENCSWIQDFSLQECCTSFDSLAHLGLIQLPLVGYTDERVYAVVKQNPLFKEAEMVVRSNLPKEYILYHEKRFIKIDELSKLFYRICVADQYV